MYCGNAANFSVKYNSHIHLLKHTHSIKRTGSCSMTQCRVTIRAYISESCTQITELVKLYMLIFTGLHILKQQPMAPIVEEPHSKICDHF